MQAVHGICGYGDKEKQTFESTFIKSALCYDFIFHGLCIQMCMCPGLVVSRQARKTLVGLRSPFTHFDDFCNCLPTTLSFSNQKENLWRKLYLDVEKKKGDGQKYRPASSSVWFTAGYGYIWPMNQSENTFASNKKPKVFHFALEYIGWM